MLLLILASIYTVFIAPLLNREKWVYKEATVEQGNLTVGVTESGSLEYGITRDLYELDLSILTEEEDDDDDEDEEETTSKYLEVEELYVAAGQRIEEGDALMKFTDDSVSDVRRLVTAYETEAQIAYSEAESEYNLSVLEAELDYQADLVGEKYASSIYSYTSQSISNEIASLEVELQECNNKITSLQEKYEDALENYDDVSEVYETAKKNLETVGNGIESVFISFQATYLNAKSQYESAQSQLDQAQTNITDNAAKITSLQTQITQAQAKAAIEKLEAKATYEDDLKTSEIAEIEYNASVEGLKETLEEAKEDLEDAKELLEAFEAFVGTDGIVYAGGSGIVTEVGYEVGDLLETTGTVASYAEADNMTVTVDVSQEDIISLSVGDSVSIDFSSYEGVAYEGVITAIETTSTSADSATVSYPVTIKVLGDTTALFGGMTTDVTFVTEEKTDVLYISKKAIVEENDRTYVYIKNAFGKKVLTEVETGLSNGVSVEIISGLEAGETYYIASRVTNEADATNTDSENSSQSTDESQTTDTFEGGDMQMPSGDMQMPSGDMGVMP